MIAPEHSPPCSRAFVHGARRVRMPREVSNDALQDAPEMSGAPRDGSLSFEGLWDRAYGAMRLERRSASIVGTYGNGEQELTIEGRQKNRRFEFTYVESGARGAGWFEIGEDGLAFHGERRADGDEAWSEWTGERRPSSWHSLDGHVRRRRRQGRRADRSRGARDRPVGASLDRDGAGRARVGCREDGSRAQSSMTLAAALRPQAKSPLDALS